VPDRGDKIVPADDPFAVVDQVFQKVENQRFDGDQAATAPQLASVGVESIVLEQVEQGSLPQPACLPPATLVHPGQRKKQGLRKDKVRPSESAFAATAAL
jgi:hypothetical protein